MNKRGRLIVFIGKPFSGKSTKLVRLANSFFKAKHSILIIPTFVNKESISRSIDYKYMNQVIKCDDLPSLDYFYKNPNLPSSIQNIFIDEFQIYNNQKAIIEYLNKGINVYAAGIISQGSVYITRMADRIVYYNNDGYDYKKSALSIGDKYGEFDDEQKFYSSIGRSASSNPFKVLYISYDPNPSKELKDNIIISNYHWVVNKQDEDDFISQISCLSQSRDKELPTAKELIDRYHCYMVYINSDKNIDISDKIKEYCKAGIYVGIY